MNAETTIVYTSGSYRIIDFICRSTAGENSGVEYQPDFSLSFVRKGSFVYNVYRNRLDAHSGKILLNKPGFEHTVDHFHDRRDECTILAFEPGFYESIRIQFGRSPGRFFDNNDIHSALVGSNPACDYLHHRLLLAIGTRRPSALSVDSLVHDIVNLTFGKLIDAGDPNPLPPSLKTHHLETVEAAKDYINRFFDRDITLAELADNSCVSPFHFSRIFKSITSYSPHQYLVDTRLKNAELLIRNTDLPITDICYSSGFGSLEYFSAAFRNKFGFSPSQFRVKSA